MSMRAYCFARAECEKKYFDGSITMLKLVSELEKHLREAIKKELT